MNNAESPSRALWLPVLLMTGALAWRVAKLKFGVPDFVCNVSPWMALAFAGTLLMPKALPWWLWPALLLGCDLAAGSGDIGGMWLVYCCYGLAALVAGTRRGQASIARSLGGTVLGSLGFYILTNTQAWWMSPLYAKTIPGWLQALTTGDPAFPPTWVFGISSLLSDAGFALLLVLAYNGEAMARRIKALPVVTAADVVTA